MYIGNIMLLVLNLPLIGIWVKILKVPYAILAPMILLFCVIGSFSLSNNIVDVFTMVASGIMGYIFKKIDYDATPLVLAMVLSKLLENSCVSLCSCRTAVFLFLSRGLFPSRCSSFLLFSRFTLSCLWPR